MVRLRSLRTNEPQLNLSYWDLGPMKLGYRDMGPLKLGYWDPPYTPLLVSESHTCPKSGNFDNPGIYGKASTIPAESVSPENAGMVGFRHFRQCRHICQNRSTAAFISRRSTDGCKYNFHASTFTTTMNS